MRSPLACLAVCADAEMKQESTCKTPTIGKKVDHSNAEMHSTANFITTAIYTSTSWTFYHKNSAYTSLYSPVERLQITTYSTECWYPCTVPVGCRRRVCLALSLLVSEEI